ncbi:flagellar basal body-associated FliL family protein [Desulfonatronospira sp.]|uniref:flagellar basal body-associated FliL family protein n=1 Tax=Desulfonatronospira sp. TaxID=1962951 RepID=UPI0025C1B2E9|nr:flagellar basal body-associated FliL family protein [Desulfonatronospira sp.]
MAKKDKDNSSDQELALDQDEISTDRSKEKVELDLDDAPFLEEDEEEEEPIPKEEIEDVDKEIIEDHEDQETAAPWWKQKSAIAAFGSVLIILLLVTGYLLIPTRQEPPLAPQPELEVVEETVEEPPEKVLKEKIVQFQPFIVDIEYGGKIHFLRTRLSLSVFGIEAAREVEDKKLILRDSIYYYLRNKDDSFLMDSNNTESISQDLMSIVQQYLGRDKLQNIVIEDYRVN